jgi:hypothetical protein
LEYLNTGLAIDLKSLKSVCPLRYAVPCGTLSPAVRCPPRYVLGTYKLIRMRGRLVELHDAAIVVHQIITDFAMIEYIRWRTKLACIARCVKSAQDLAFCRITSHVQQLDFVDAREAAVVGELAHHALLFV